MSATRVRMAFIAAAAACTAAFATARPVGADDAHHGRRGASGSVEVAHPGCVLRPKAVRDDGAPVTVRVVRTGEGRSRIEYVGWVTGTFDLVPLLERSDGRALEGLGSVTVDIETQLPPGAGTDLYGRIERELRFGSPYRLLVGAALVAWVAVPAIVVGRRALRRADAPTPEPVVHAPTVVERLLAEVARARGAEPSTEDRARLELLLLQAVRDARDADPASGVARARTDARSSRAIAAVERWLHAPAPGDRAAALDEIDALRLEPGVAP